MENSNTKIQEHYSNPNVRSRVQDRVTELTEAKSAVTWDRFSDLDQFHVGGFKATQEFINRIKIPAGSRVLDLGSGLGGPARFCAATHQCTVTGIDLTEQFVEDANAISKACGLEHQTKFVQGDATQLPFGDGAFDVVYTQHVAMNIPEKARLYQEAFRVLKAGGNFALYDIIRGENTEPVLYPAPWAKTAETSFPESVETYQRLLGEAGFKISTTLDLTESAPAGLSPAGLAPAPSGGGNSTGSGNGETAAVPGFVNQSALQNLIENFETRRLRLIQIFCTKPG